MKHACLIVVLVIFAFAAAPARAQIPSDYEGVTIADVVIPGDAGDTLDDEIIGIHRGAPLTHADVSAMMDRLIHTARFSDLRVLVDRVPGGVRVTIELATRILLARLEVNGNRAMSDDDVARTLQIGPGDEIDDVALAELRKRLRDTYLVRGYAQATVDFERRDTNDPARKILIANVNEGDPDRLSQLDLDDDAPEAPFDEMLREELSISHGEILDRREVASGIHNAEERLRRAGFLEASYSNFRIEGVGANAVLVIHCATGPKYEVLVEGHEPVSRTAVSNAVHLGDERFTGASAEHTIREKVQQLFERQGFVDAQVNVTHERIDDRHATLTIHVQHGPQVIVNAVHFPGSHFFSESFLRNQVDSYLEDDIDGSTLLFPVDSEVVDRIGFGERPGRTPREVPAPLVVEPAKVFYAPTYEEALAHIKELYQSAGFLQAEISAAQLVRDSETSAHVDVAVAEGPRTLLYEIRFEGNDAIASRELLNQVSLTSEMPFGYLALEEARIHVLDHYRDLGYFYAKIDPVVHFSEDHTRASVVFQVIERYQVHVSDVVVRGLSKAHESVVRGVVTLRAGDLFRPTLARESEQRLLQLGIFSGATIAPEAEDLPAREKRIVVTVSERPDQYLEGSGGLSTGQGLRGGFEYGMRDLFGDAVNISLRTQFTYQFFFVDRTLQERFDALSAVNRLGRNITASLALPYIPGLPDLHGSLNLVHIRANEVAFGYDKDGVVAALNYRPWRRLSITLSEEAVYNDVGLFVTQDLAALQATTTDPRLQRLLRVPQGQSALISTNLTMSLDFRDSPFVPTRGFYTSLTTEWARTLYTKALENGDQFFSNFIKMSFTANAYVPVAKNWVFAIQARIGRIFRLNPNSQTYPDRQFFMGGVDTMRGFAQEAMIPQELATAIQNGKATPDALLRGGDAFVLLRAELRFPIYGALQGGLFSDIGNLWADARDLNLTQVRPSVGVGIRIATPVGPLAFDYGFVIQRRQAPVSTDGTSFTLAQPFEPVGSFHFSIGLF